MKSSVQLFCDQESYVFIIEPNQKRYTHTQSKANKCQSISPISDESIQMEIYIIIIMIGIYV